MNLKIGCFLIVSLSIIDANSAIGSDSWQCYVVECFLKWMVVITDFLEVWSSLVSFSFPWDSHLKWKSVYCGRCGPRGVEFLEGPILRCWRPLHLGLARGHYLIQWSRLCSGKLAPSSQSHCWSYSAWCEGRSSPIWVVFLPDDWKNDGEHSQIFTHYGDYFCIICTWMLWI